MKEHNIQPIDIVITWVDGSDKEWLKEKQHYNSNIDIDDSAARYRDYGTLIYVLRSIEKFAPWVRKVFLVTNGQIPSWLNLQNSKIRLVKHSDFIPSEYLPTFSSHPIEWNLNKIDELSENFIYFNDDMLLASAVKPSDFFKNDLPCDTLGLGIVRPVEFFSSIPFNNMMVVNKHFNFKEVCKQNKKKFFNLKYGKRMVKNIILSTQNVFYGMYDPHVALPLKKTYFDLLWQQEYDLINETCKNKFRSKNDISPWLVRYWQLLTGNFEPRSAKFSAYFRMDEFIQNPKTVNILKKAKYKAICINDVGLDNQDFVSIQEKFKAIMDTILGEKSSFEK